MSDRRVSLARVKNLLVKLRRQFVRRLGGDAVVHWVAVVESPSIRVTGRSIDTVTRSLRARLATRPGWDTQAASSVSLVFDLADGAQSTQRVIDAHRRAADEAIAAADALELATCEAIRVLLVGAPAVSVRDAARLLGVPTSLVQRIATKRTSDARKRVKKAERQAALQGRRAAGEARWYSMLYEKSED